MTNSPKTYYEWVTILEAFANGDNNVLEEMKKGTFKIDAGTAVRFYTKVGEIYDIRKKRWLDSFQRSFQSLNIKTENEFSILLHNSKQRLLPLIIFTEIEAFPEELKNILKDDLVLFTDEIKKTLKDSTKNSIQDKEKVLSILNSFELRSDSRKNEITITTDKKNTNQSTGRKIIF